MPATAFSEYMGKSFKACLSASDGRMKHSRWHFVGQRPEARLRPSKELLSSGMPSIRGRIAKVHQETRQSSQRVADGPAKRRRFQRRTCCSYTSSPYTARRVSTSFLAALM